MQRLAETQLPTRFGTFQMIAYPSGFDTFPHVVLFNGTLGQDQTYDVRIHSECMTGDVFSSVRCECGEQLDCALDYIARCGGVVLYLRQEGRGIGLVNKMHAYNLQDAGFNTREANLHLGFHADPRDYTEAIAILHDLGI